ncbi:MAG: hypothetical protein ACREO0_14050 [Pseudoxanthomonas sp.]
MIESKWKCISLLTTGSLAVLAEAYLSGYLTVLLPKLEIPLRWNTYWGYFEALDLPQIDPHAKKIKTNVRRLEIEL